MPDYREEFYANYHVTNKLSDKPDKGHYEVTARQFAGRWGKWLPAHKSSRCLDLACGSGEFLYYLKLEGYSDIHGVDLNPVEINRAEQMDIPNLACDDVLKFMESCDIKFDLVSAFNLFEHLRKDEIIKLLKLVYNSLNPNGKLIVVTPNALSIFSGSTRYWDFSHETSFTPASWRQLSNLVGFDDIIFEEYGPIPYSLKGRFRTLLWKFIRLVIMAMSYIEVGSPRDRSRVYTSDMKVVLIKNQD